MGSARKEETPAQTGLRVLQISKETRKRGIGHSIARTGPLVMLGVLWSSSVRSEFLGRGHPQIAGRVKGA